MPEATASTRVKGGEPQRFVQGMALPAGWWSWFGSGEMDALVARAFAGSPTVEAARARLRGAASALAAARALRSPELAGVGSGRYGSQGAGGGGIGQGGGVGGGVGGGGAQPSDPNVPADPNAPTQPGGSGGGRSGPSIGGQSFAVYTATATITYDFDLAGGNRRRAGSAAAQVEARAQELQGAYLTLAGNIVSTVLDRAALSAQYSARETLIRAQQQRLDLIRLQVAEGATSRADLRTVEAEVAALRASLPPLRARIAAAEHAIAELIGEPPGSAIIPPVDLAALRLPRTVPIALNSQLVRTRPDILAAEATLRGASAEIGVAEAALYPQLTLDASFGLGGVNSVLGRFYEVAGGLLAPIFDGGRRRAERDVAVAAWQEALADYRARVLTAFTQVADGIRLLENDALELAERTIALEAARDAYELAQFRSREGAISVVDVLVVQRQYQDAVLAQVDALSRRFQDTATLFAALGPGPIDAAGLRSVTAGTHLAATRAALAAGEAPASVGVR